MAEQDTQDARIEALASTVADQANQIRQLQAAISAIGQQRLTLGASGEGGQLVVNDDRGHPIATLSGLAAGAANVLTDLQVRPPSGAHVDLGLESEVGITITDEAGVEHTRMVGGQLALGSRQGVAGIVAVADDSDNTVAVLSGSHGPHDPDHPAAVLTGLRVDGSDSSSIGLGVGAAPAAIRLADGDLVHTYLGEGTLSLGYRGVAAGRLVVFDEDANVVATLDATHGPNDPDNPPGVLTGLRVGDDSSRIDLGIRDQTASIVLTDAGSVSHTTLAGGRLSLGAWDPDHGTNSVSGSLVISSGDEGSVTASLDGAGQLTLGCGPTSTGGGEYDGRITLLSGATNNRTLLLDGATGDITLFNADCAEEFECGEDRPHPGELVALDDRGRLRLAVGTDDQGFIGVVSGAGALRPAVIMDHREGSETRVPVALMGKVSCRIDGMVSIAPGDWITVSPEPGVGTKLSEPGQIAVGRALEPAQPGENLVSVLVSSGVLPR